MSVVEVFLSLTNVILFCNMYLSNQAKGLIFIGEEIYYLQYCIEIVIFLTTTGMSVSVHIFKDFEKARNHGNKIKLFASQTGMLLIGIYHG